MEKTIKLITAVGLVLSAVGEMLKQLNLYQKNTKTVIPSGNEVNDYVCGSSNRDDIV